MKRDEVSPAGADSDQGATTPPQPGHAQDGSPTAGERPFGLRRSAAASAVAVSRPRMRSDLRFVHEDPGSDDVPRLPGLLRIIDLRNERKFDFTAQEHFLCREADGTATPEELQLRLGTLTDSPLTAAQVAKFFRRLNILGLLEPEEVAPAAAAPRFRGRAPRPSGPAPTGQRAAPDGVARTPASKLTLVGAEAPVKPAAPAGPDTGAPSAATAAALESGTRPDTPEIDASEPDAASPDAGAAPTRRFTPRKPATNLDPLDEDNDFADLFGAGAAGFGGAEGEGRFGGRMRPGMGGMGGGMGGAMGGMAGMGGMGGMGGAMGGMGAGMMGMRGRPMQDAREQELGPTQFPLFNPDLLFRVLYFTFWPLKFLLWTMLPISAFAGLTLIQKMPEISVDLARIMASSDLIVRLLVGLIVVNLGSRIAQGVAITAQGGRVRSLGINLLMGFSPRVYIDDSAIEQMDRRGQMWAHGAPLLFRLSLFVFGLLFWAVSRESGGAMPQMALTVAQFGLIMFALTAWPLFPAEGMRFMGAALGEPKIMIRSLMAARGLFLTGHLPPMIRREEAWPLALFAVGTIVTSVVLLGVMAIFILMGLQQSLGGLGVSLFLGLMAISTLWFIATARFNRRKLKGRGMGGGMGAMARPRSGPAMAAGMAVGGARTLRGPDQPQADANHPPARQGFAATTAPARVLPKTDVEKLPNRARVVWSLILCAVLVAAFLPYRYEAGGEVEILPAARGTAVARTDGEIVEVYVAQGDRVTAGTPLVRLSDWDQLSDVAVREARLAGARATLAKLEAGAQPEEIDVARAKLARSEATAAYRKAEVERARSLVASETASAVTLEKAEADYATAVADVEADKAMLALTLAGATEEELEIARADVDRQERELAYERDELQRTRILAPMDGTVVTGDLHLRVGDYLKVGDAFLEIEQTDVVTATIAIPEADIAFIKPGQPVRLRAASQSDMEVTGEIRQVAPVAEDAGYGRIVRATAVFPNPDGLLRSSMTGWAKIEGDEMLAWQAYLRTIVRFVKIDVWSWIP